MITAREAYDKTTELLKGYEEGDLHGGNPMQYIEQYAKEYHYAEFDFIHNQQGLIKPMFSRVFLIRNEKPFKMYKDYNSVAHWLDDKEFQKGEIVGFQYVSGIRIIKFALWAALNNIIRSKSIYYKH